MNLWLLAGGLLLLGAAVAHSLLGEKLVLQRLFRRADGADAQSRRASDDPTLRATLRLTWHSLSVTLLGFAGLMFTAAFQSGGLAWPAALRLVAATFLALTVLSLVIARGRHIGWMWYAAAAVAAWLST